MSIQLNQENNGRVLAVHFSDTLKKSDYEQFVLEAERLVQQQGKLRVLIDMENFHGLEIGVLWEDTKFAIKHYADIQQIAVVGENKWQHGMTTICKPFTKAQVRYFDHSDATEARKWLENE